MYADLVAPDPAPLKYLLTYKMSQDHLELFLQLLDHQVGVVITLLPASSLASTNSF